jgi:hypothetical protein
MARSGVQVSKTVSSFVARDRTSPAGGRRRTEVAAFTAFTGGGAGPSPRPMIGRQTICEGKTPSRVGSSPCPSESARERETDRAWGPYT